MQQARVRVIDCNTRLKPNEMFIELPEVDFCGRSILVQVLPTDNPANVAIVCNKQLKDLMKRDSIAAVNEMGIFTPPKKIIRPN